MSDDRSPPRGPDTNYNQVFEKLVGEPKDTQALLQGLIAYGLYKVAKREWVSEHREREGRKPSEGELDAYTNTWTASQLSNVQERAAQILTEYASAVIQEEEPRILHRALRGSFWRGVWPSIVASLIYTALLIAVALTLAYSGIDLIGIFRSAAGQ